MSPIDRFVVRLVRWPLRMERRHGVGDVRASLPGVVLEIGTADGLVGWGEAAPWSVFSGTAEAAAAALDVYLRPLAMGRAASEAPQILAEAERALVGEPAAKAALETALLDLRGRETGLPAVELLGGAVRDRVPLSVSLANPDLGADLAFAAERVAEGVRLFKVKTGFLDHAQDLARLERIRGALPDEAELRVDYNQALAPHDALRRLRDVEAFRPGFIEQPVARERRDVMAALARALDAPILADESVFTPEEAVELARSRFADGVSIKLMKCGGPRRALAIAAITGAAGLPAYGGTMYEAGLALAAGLHAACAAPNLTLGAEFYTAAHVLGVEILEEPLRLADGASHLPVGPGLGVAVDRDALASVTVETRAGAVL